MITGNMVLGATGGVSGDYLSGVSIADVTNGLITLQFEKNNDPTDLTNMYEISCPPFTYNRDASGAVASMGLLIMSVVDLAISDPDQTVGVYASVPSESAQRVLRMGLLTAEGEDTILAFVDPKTGLYLSFDKFVLEWDTTGDDPVIKAIVSSGGETKMIMEDNGTKYMIEVSYVLDNNSDFAIKALATPLKQVSN